MPETQLHMSKTTCHLALFRLVSRTLNGRTFQSRQTGSKETQRYVSSASTHLPARAGRWVDRQAGRAGGPTNGQTKTYLSPCLRHLTSPLGRLVSRTPSTPYSASSQGPPSPPRPAGPDPTDLTSPQPPPSGRRPPSPLPQPRHKIPPHVHQPLLLLQLRPNNGVKRHPLPMQIIQTALLSHAEGDFWRGGTR